MSIDRFVLFVLVVAAAVIVVAIGLTASYATRDGSWLARAGALTVILGAVTTSSRLLRHDNSPKEWFRRMVARGGFSREKVGLALMIVGTLIWAFGDLVIHLLPVQT